MKTKVLLLSALLIILSINSNAQENEKHFGVEINAGLSIPLNKLDNTQLNPGFGFEGILHYRFIPYTGVYAGWGWNRFGADESFAGKDVCFEETGYVFGLQFKHPFGQSPVSYFVRAGGLYNHIEIENAEGDIIMDSGHGWGWQLAGGIDLPIGRNWSVMPGLKFNSLKTEVENEGIITQLNQNYVSVRVGIIKRF